MKHSFKSEGSDKTEVKSSKSLSESQQASEQNSDKDVPIKREIHPYIKKILEKEKSEEICKLLVEANREDEERERLIEEAMTFKNSMKTITSDIITVTNLLGTKEHDLKTKDTEIMEKEISVDHTDDSIDIKSEVPFEPPTPDIKVEIRKFTEDIIKITKLLTEVKRKDILKIQPDDVYMKDGIDAMSCATMDASPTR